MVRRFLVYSLDHARPIKVLFADMMKYRNIRVKAIEGDTVQFLLPGRKTLVSAPIADILSASYARGDDGDTLQYVKSEDQENQENGKSKSAPS